MHTDRTQDRGPAQDDASAEARTPAEVRDAEMRTLIARLARPHPSGGKVVERASLLAEGHDFAAIIAWIEAHGGRPEAAAPATAGRGLHSARVTPSADRQPLRFVLPPGALGG